MIMAASQLNAKAAVGKLQSTKGRKHISINLLTNVQSRLATQAMASAPAVAAHPNMAITIIEPVTD
jgi:hypothetical protein